MGIAFPSLPRRPVACTLPRASTAAAAADRTDFGEWPLYNPRRRCGQVPRGNNRCCFRSGGRGREGERRGGFNCKKRPRLCFCSLPLSPPSLPFSSLVSSAKFSLVYAYPSDFNRAQSASEPASQQASQSFSQSVVSRVYGRERGEAEGEGASERRKLAAAAAAAAKKEKSQ